MVNSATVANQKLEQASFAIKCFKIKRTSVLDCTKKTSAKCLRDNNRDHRFNESWEKRKNF